ncbi:isoleucine--tRNA ligase [Mesorhizobium waimense]|uniref:Isoleucine--tRNA ligase n=1 Tax=Mesorhizobium waimense TaxID=1300307 RepID=A0A3A5L5T3_9HYPH|nr:isoleucine--tRNA ligase [Mesorhizobium waimense]RJT41438.1 isoleucine--tRNA ligase [Mesorhizobium waimense]
MAKDYRSTVFLPTTEFPMKAGLPAREPEILRRWEEIGLYEKLRADSKGREQFILHDGPPYANGQIHIGHALNKILKDVSNRSKQMMGYDANFVPGWDCHGLPIEWKIEERYRAAGKSKDDLPVAEFRNECRQFAQHWIDVQREEFKRLGVIGDWANPYLTMAFAAEAQIAGELHKFLMNGGLYKGSKPVLWSTVERTALAEAEVEYQEHTSHALFVKFPVVKPSVPLLDGATILIWTTTAWTLPANRALALSQREEYCRLRVEAIGENSLARVGEEIVVASVLAESVARSCGIEAFSTLGTVKGADVLGTICAHPLRGKGYDYDVPVLHADFVDMETGSGFVHTAPGHGADDYILLTAHGFDVPQTIDEDGRYFSHIPIFGGDNPARIFDDNGKEADANLRVIEVMTEAGALLGRSRLRHQYPHSWRSKAPLIFRNTPQWFISMASNALREKALAAIDATSFYPPRGRNRLRAMIEQRPDWVVSRQRAWGVPIAIFEHRETGELLRDDSVNQRILTAFREKGADAWFTAAPDDFLGDAYNKADWTMVTDILDVWFDSGSSHAFVLEQRPDLKWPASLYLEGSDQHRGWFHSSLLESAGTRGTAPYEAVLTHGFTLDEKGRKMSKSLGNTIEPQEVIKQTGADILRLWVVSSDYSEDLTVGKTVIQSQSDAYRRLRNTLRYLLGNLAGFTEAEKLPYDQMPELERWILHRLAELGRIVTESCERYDFHRLYVALHNFCAIELSSFYFDIRKDALYCDAPESLRRRATRTVLDHLFGCLVKWLAPVICFTAEEAWLTRFPSSDGSVHRQQFPAIPEEWLDLELAAKWEKIRRIRRAVTAGLERERVEKRIGSSLQAHPTVHAAADDLAVLETIDFAEICITSAVTLQPGDSPSDAFRIEDVPNVAVTTRLADGSKCERCWKIAPEVGQLAGSEELCQRCAGAIVCVAA